MPFVNPHWEHHVIIGIGIDTVEIQRFRAVLDRQKDRFVDRVFTAGEKEYCRGHRDPVPHFAARFAAKEALFKALGTGWAKGVTWLDVEVRKEKGGAPFLALTGEARRLSVSLGSRKSHLSLSHTDESAVAMVVLEA